MGIKKIGFVEGAPNSPNGDLRQGLSKLLSQKLQDKLPKIVFGGGKSKTVNKFKTNKLAGDVFLLLIDLDKPENEIEKDLSKYGLLKHKENVFYMIQEMESWFLSQPEILDEFYGLDNNRKRISEKLPKRKMAEISNPHKELERITKTSEKGVYHKIIHAVELLKLLDATKLEAEFIDFKRLVERLR